MEKNRNENDVFMDFFNSYNECFYKKDMEKLKTFYDIANNNLVFFDNHKNNDTFTVDKHLELISDFFTKGKSTESGDVEELIIENLNIFKTENSGCICFIAKYKSFPDPSMRCTYYIEKIQNELKILHAHASFKPDK